MTAKDELAKLKREVEELKTKLSAPKSEPFVPEPYQRFDPTAGMSMPPSALAAMVAAVPRPHGPRHCDARWLRPNGSKRSGRNPQLANDHRRSPWRRQWLGEGNPPWTSAGRCSGRPIDGCARCA